MRSPKHPLSLSRKALVGLAAAVVFATTLTIVQPAQPASALPAGFTEETVISGLNQPTNVKFAADGRVFVAEKSGIVKVFDGLNDPTPTVFADLRTKVHNFWDRGLLGLALPPNFPTDPSVYVLYTYDAAIGGQAPRWGSPNADYDDCPSPPGATNDGCVVSGRLSKLQASGDKMVGAEQVIIEDWCAQFPSHTIGSIDFGPDGYLYASGGEGASFNYSDWGQSGNPKNPCGDPGGANPTPPTAEGGSLRSQDIRTMGDPVGLDGSIIRIDPATGAGAPGNPMAGNADANAKRMIAHGARNPFRMTFRPGTNELWFGDVGAGDWEEINRLQMPGAGSSVPNFGWPCYEGNGRQPGFDNANLNICENLYNEGTGAVVRPHFTYKHSDRVASDNCPTGGSSITGLAFGRGTAYPAEYNGSLFFADYTRNCIYVMMKGADGLPNPNDVRPFQTPASGPTSLEFSPQGELVYTAMDAGQIKRFKYNGGTTTPPPTNCATGQYKAEYFNGMTLGGPPAFSRCEASINNAWGAGGPGNGVPNDNFSARWTGTQNFAAGTYKFTTTSDDGIRVWIDDIPLIDSWTDHPEKIDNATRTLTAGTHNVRVEYYEGGGDAVAKFSWTQESGGGPTNPPNECAVGQFKADYYKALTPGTTPFFSRCETGINNDWAAGGPGNGIPNDVFSVRWTGTQTFEAGTYNFTATADDGVRVYVDGAPVIDKWIDQEATAHNGTATLTAGNHEVKMEYYEATGDAVAKLNWVKAGGGGTTPPPTGCATGQFKAEYFNGIALQGATVLDRCEGAIDNAWGGDGPGNGVPNDNFSARWTGTHNFDAGTYEFTSASDDGIRVFVDGVAVIDKWIDQAETMHKASRQMTAGPHQVKVEYYEGGGNAVAKVNWTKTGTGGGTTPPPPTGCADGQFKAEYFNGVALQGGAQINRCETGINNDWAKGGPGAPLGVDNFSVRWTGTHTFEAGTYDFAASTDDGMRVFVDNFPVIDKWLDQPATTYTGTIALAAGQHTVRVEYYELGGDAVAKVNWGKQASADAPVPVIDTPLGTTKFKVDDLISFSGHASDPQQGNLPASALKWTLTQEHCPANVCHTHTVRTWTGQAAGSFNAPDHEYPSHLELKLTATDAQGNATTVVRKIEPQTVELTFTTNQWGLALTVGQSSEIAPFKRTVIVGSNNSMSANTPQVIGGTTYNFANWSNGGAQTQNFIAPAVPTTYSANYTTVGGGTPTYTSYAKINFQPGDAAVPAGYLVDNGEIFGARNGLNYGWNTGNVAATRDRNMPNAPDQRYDTLIHMQQGGNYAWEIAVPNGEYRVRLVSGDPGHIDSVYRINLEGQLALSLTPTDAVRWGDTTTMVNVTDGRLTVSSGAGAANNKLSFIEIERRL